MKRETKYNIIVLSDQHAANRQFQVSKVLVISLMVAIVLGAVSLVGLSIYFLKYSRTNRVDQSQLAEVEKENDALKLANARYYKANVEMEDKLKLFHEKTTKLAQFVGVEPTGFDTDGMGGPDLLENELSRYLRYDLGLLVQKTQLLENQYEKLEEAFNDQTDLLDSTPSIFPARGWLSSGFNYRIDPFTQKKTWHNGIDISCHRGTPIYAPAKGVVSFRGYQGGSGNLLILKHGNGIITKYAHMSKFNVSKGQRLKRGDLIGYVGSTGRSTAPHLHYEIHKDGRSINPMKYIIREASSF